MRMRILGEDDEDDEDDAAGGGDGCDCDGDGGGGGDGNDDGNDFVFSFAPPSQCKIQHASSNGHQNRSEPSVLDPARPTFLNGFPE